jgi:hypothetical protein
MLTGEGDWAGGIVGLERNPEVVKDLTGLCDYVLEVLKTMPESQYRSDVEKRTNFKLKVLNLPHPTQPTASALTATPGAGPSFGCL